MPTTTLKRSASGSMPARAIPNTFGNYRKEAERFLLWCLVEKRTALSSIRAGDAAQYLRWLENLGRLDDKAFAAKWREPQSRWLGPKKRAPQPRRLAPFQRPAFGREPPQRHCSRAAALQLSQEDGLPHLQSVRPGQSQSAAFEGRRRSAGICRPIAYARAVARRHGTTDAPAGRLAT